MVERRMPLQPLGADHHVRLPDRNQADQVARHALDQGDLDPRPALPKAAHRPGQEMAGLGMGDGNPEFARSRIAPLGRQACQRALGLGDPGAFLQHGTTERRQLGQPLALA